jgi:Family of unknown function (DUF6526)
MNTQSYANHVRVHPVYHYVGVPVSLGLIGLSGIDAFLNFSLSSIILLIATILIHLTIFLARDYAKKNQDRIIRLELRLRYLQLTGKRLEEIESHLSLGQLLALRFASDEEFIDMLRDPETQNKTADQIKKQIIQWNADWMRV